MKMIILEENFKWHLEAFASELFIYSFRRHFYPKHLTIEEYKYNFIQRGKKHKKVLLI